MPFLRLTRDRRGYENTFLMHADRPGDRPRLLYWYRTAPGIVQGRAALDEDAIRAIEEQHPDIDFDWPAIIALSEVMTPEDEAPARPPQQQQRQGRKPRNRGRDESAEPRRDHRPPPSDEVGEASEAPADDESLIGLDASDPLQPVEPLEPVESRPVEPVEPLEPLEPVGGRTYSNRLLEDLVGREIAARLRARYSEIVRRIEDQDAASQDALMRRAEPLDTELWRTPEAILEGVRNADALYERLRAELHAAP